MPKNVALNRKLFVALEPSLPAVEPAGTTAEQPTAVDKRHIQNSQKSILL